MIRFETSMQCSRVMKPRIMNIQMIDTQITIQPLQHDLYLLVLVNDNDFKR